MGPDTGPFLPQQIPATMSDKDGGSCTLPVRWKCSCRDSAMPRIDLQAELRGTQPRPQASTPQRVDRLTPPRVPWCCVRIVHPLRSQPGVASSSPAGSVGETGALHKGGPRTPVMAGGSGMHRLRRCSRFAAAAIDRAGTSAAGCSLAMKCRLRTVMTLVLSTGCARTCWTPLAPKT